MRNLSLILCSLGILLPSSWCINANEFELATQERLSRLERAIHSRDSVDVLARLQKIEQENAELLGRFEELQYELRRLGKKQALFFQEVERLVKENQPHQNHSQTQVNTGSDERALYDSHINLLRNGQIEQAKNGFLTYLREHPQGQFAPNAHYWLGELFLKEGYLKSALDHFDAVLLNHPDSHKTPDALYKKGITLFKVNRDVEATNTLNQLIQSHPDAPAARLAKIYLERRE